MAKKRTKKRTAKKGRKGGRRKMSALQRKYFGKGHGAVRGGKRKAAKRTKKRSAKRGTKRARKSETGLRHRVARLEKFHTAQKGLNRKTHTMLRHVVGGLDTVFRHTGLSKPKGLHAPSLTKQLGG